MSYPYLALGLGKFYVFTLPSLLVVLQLSSSLALFSDPRSPAVWCALFVLSTCSHGQNAIYGMYANRKPFLL